MTVEKRTLPARYYTDPAIFAQERERIFATMWVCAGRTEEVAAPGDFVLREVAGESVIVTRRKDGALAAHYNVCRHRGTRLCTEAAGHFPDRIQCPYHGVDVRPRRPTARRAAHGRRARVSTRRQRARAGPRRPNGTATCS